MYLETHPIALLPGALIVLTEKKKTKKDNNKKQKQKNVQINHVIFTQLAFLRTILFTQKPLFFKVFSKAMDAPLNYCH